MWYNISCFFLIIFFLFFNPTFHFLESSLSSFFSFSFFRLVFSPPHTYPLFSYVSTFLFLLHAWIPVLVFSSSSVLLCLPFCFYFLSSSAHFTHTQPTMFFWLLLYVCIFVFYFLSSSSHFTQTHSRQRELAFVYLCFLMRRERVFFWWEVKERARKKEKKKLFFIQPGDYFNRQNFLKVL